MPRMSGTVKTLNNTVDSWKESFNFSNFVKERKISVNAWITFGFVIISLLLALVTAVAPGWAWTREIRGNADKIFEGEVYGQYGIWYVCWTLIEDPSRYSCNVLNHLHGIPGWWFGVQAMGTITLLGCVGSFSALCAYIFVKSFNRAPFIMTSVVITTITSSVLNIPFFVVFCTMFLKDMWWCCPGMTIEVPEYHLHYCFVIACAATPFNIISAIFAYKEFKMVRNPPPPQHYDESQMDAMSHVSGPSQFREQFLKQRISGHQYYDHPQYQDYPMKQGYPPHDDQGYGDPRYQGYYGQQGPYDPRMQGQRGYDDPMPYDPRVQGHKGYDEPMPQGGNPYHDGRPNQGQYGDRRAPQGQYEARAPPAGGQYEDRMPARGNGRELYPADGQPQVLRMGTHDSSVA